MFTTILAFFTKAITFFTGIGTFIATIISNREKKRKRMIEEILKFDKTGEDIVKSKEDFDELMEQARRDAEKDN